MGWASSLVSPPDGDLDQFMTSCRNLRVRRPKVLYPAHGAPIDDPIARIDWLINHRNGRTDEILKLLGDGPATASTLAAMMYRDVPDGLLAAATRNVFAHLISLHTSGQITASPTLQSDAVFTLI